ncbi:efflux RND transporter periplasmic adaptor subunit [Paenibacillus sp. P96]|uniref:Efflux RND transporter periplasmic adaptor subunit n=1 Tax=Paenibacillus zeirhizosphaerae TaxID=2987519 RepID=A0ABT9FW29_9BACL|nr:efflux RND transporter periplasmic adaptor subunit [Paenibacillus sp. P96]MDP4098825.1 efflux RND transporter periplasmic adaptor subunit [Paenibacillus sp. P96]
MLKRNLHFLVAGVMLLTSSACSSSGSTESNAVDTSGAKVAITTVQKQSVSAMKKLSGTLEASQEVSVAFELSGLVQAALFEVGDPVSQNQVLVKLDSSNYQLQLEKANNSIAEAQSGLKSAAAAMAGAEASISSAEAQMNAASASLNKTVKGARQQEIDQARTKVERAQAALAKSRTDAARVQSLYEQGIATKEEQERAQLALTNASKDVEDTRNALSLLEEGATQEDLETAKSGVQQARAARESATATLKQAEAAHDQASVQYEQAIVAKEEAKLSLSKTSVKSPISGVILEKNVTAGELTSSGQTVYRIGQIDQLKVLLPVPDHEIEQLKKGDKVNLSLYGQERAGTVSRIYPATNSDTGSINVEVMVSNPKHDWAPGQVVKAGLSTQQSKKLLIPAKAVLSSGNETYVYKVVNNKAVKTIVKIGELTGNKLEITDGLSVGDAIVTTGASSMYDGLVVQPVEEQAND